jgi:hypothetical protein
MPWLPKVFALKIVFAITAAGSALFIVLNPDIDG